MSSDINDLEWKCACAHTNPDFDERCNGCGQERYPEEEDDSLSNLYSDESHRMAEAQRMK